MQKRTIFGIVGLLFMTAILAGLWIKPAGATEEPEPCVPSDAWTETIQHAEESHLIYEYQKYVRGIVQQRDNGQDRWHDTGKGFDWEPWVGGSFQWDETNVAVLESGPHHAVQEEWTQGNGNKHWRKLTTEYRYQPTGKSDKVVDKEAWTEVIEHPAVTCPEEPDPCLEDPTLPECPVVNPNCLDTPDAPGCEEPEEPPVVEEPPVIDEPVCPKVIASDEFEVDCGKGTPTKVSKNPPHAFTVVTCEGTFLVTIKGDNSLWEWVSDKSTGKRCKIEEGL